MQNKNNIIRMPGRGLPAPIEPGEISIIRQLDGWIDMNVGGEFCDDFDLAIETLQWAIARLQSVARQQKPAAIINLTARSA